jgi:hypothetical protein
MPRSEAARCQARRFLGRRYRGSENAMPAKLTTLASSMFHCS